MNLEVINHSFHSTLFDFCYHDSVDSLSKEEIDMGIRDRYDDGIFCWVELATKDASAAKVCYSELFG